MAFAQLAIERIKTLILIIVLSDFGQFLLFQVGLS
jgi:hypothetical protein